MYYIMFLDDKRTEPANRMAFGDLAD